MPFEKSSFLRTCTVSVSRRAVADPLLGEEPDAKFGFLRAGDWRDVLMGELERGGNRTSCDLRAVRTVIGSGAEPAYPK